MLWTVKRTVFKKQEWLSRSVLHRLLFQQVTVSRRGSGTNGIVGMFTIHFENTLVSIVKMHTLGTNNFSSFPNSQLISTTNTISHSWTNVDKGLCLICICNNKSEIISRFRSNHFCHCYHIFEWNLFSHQWHKNCTILTPSSAKTSSIVLCF